MNIRFNEKSIFDEDIQVFDESNFLIAEIIKKRGYFVLSYEEQIYYIETNGILNLKSFIKTEKDDSIVAEINTTSTITCRINVKNEKFYFVFLNAIDYNFKLKNEKKEIVLNCLNKVFTNNGTASFKTEIEIIIVLFSILLMTNRRRIFQQKLI